MNYIDTLNIPIFKQGGIHIKKKNRGKFTLYCNGKVTQACIDKAKRSGNKKLIKRAVFAENSRKWAKKHDGGGLLTLDEELAVKRALLGYKPASNYSEAIDMDISKFREDFTDFALRLGSALGVNIKTGLSNCTLTASLWLNPKTPIGRAATIVTDTINHNFVQADKPTIGSLVIASKDPSKYKDGVNNVYHTMLLTGFADKDYEFLYNDKKYQIKKGEPLVTYSRGKNDPSSYRKNIPLKVYNDQGEGKTFNRYFRYSPNILPEIIIEQ